MLTPYESVDAETQELMQRLIREAFHGCTVIAVAHRLDTILDFDLVVVLDGGRLVECDSPTALLARESEFRDLYRSGKSERIGEDEEKEYQDLSGRVA